MTHSERLYIALVTPSMEKAGGLGGLAARGVMKGVGMIGKAAPFLRSTIGRTVRPAFSVAKGMGEALGGDVSSAARAAGQGVEAAGAKAPGLGERLYNFGQQGKQQLNPMIDSAKSEMVGQGAWGKAKNLVSMAPTGASLTAAAALNPWFDVPSAVGSVVGTWAGNKENDMAAGAAGVAHAAENMPWQQRLGFMMNPGAMRGQLPPEVQAMMQKMYPQAQQPAGAQQPGVLDSLMSMISPQTGRGMVPGQLQTPQ